MAPPTDCIAPIGEDLILRRCKAEVARPTSTRRSTRRATVYRGNPFLIEVGLAYGGEMSADDSITVYRYANRVPLQYQPGACAITKAVSGTDWKSYQMQQPRGALPVGPIAADGAHRERVGSLHVGEQGRHRPLPRDHQGDPPRSAGVRPARGHLHPQAQARSRRS